MTTKSSNGENLFWKQVKIWKINSFIETGEKKKESEWPINRDCRWLRRAPSKEETKVLSWRDDSSSIRVEVLCQSKKQRRIFMRENVKLRFQRRRSSRRTNRAGKFASTRRSGKFTFTRICEFWFDEQIFSNVQWGFQSNFVTSLDSIFWSISDDNSLFWHFVVLACWN